MPKSKNTHTSSLISCPLATSMSKKKKVRTKRSKGEARLTFVQIVLLGPVSAWSLMAMTSNYALAELGVVMPNQDMDSRTEEHEAVSWPSFVN